MLVFKQGNDCDYKKAECAVLALFLFYDLSVFQNYYFHALHIPSPPAHIFYQTTIWRIKAWNILGRKTGSICQGEY